MVYKKKKSHRDTTNFICLFELETIVSDYLFCACQFRIVELDDQAGIQPRVGVARKDLL
jgi:hypothetical protein